MSWISAGPTSEALLRSGLLVPGATVGERRMGIAPWRKVTQHLKQTFHVLPTTPCHVAHGQGSWAFPLFFFFFFSLKAHKSLFL